MYPSNVSIHCEITLMLTNLHSFKFREKNSLPPPPPFSESKHEIKDVFVNAMADLNFEEQTDSVKYRYNFSTQLDIIQYFELTQKLNDNKNKKLKRLTTMYIANRAHGG